MSCSQHPVICNQSTSTNFSIIFQEGHVGSWMRSHFLSPNNSFTHTCTTGKSGHTAGCTTQLYIELTSLILLYVDLDIYLYVLSPLELLQSSCCLTRRSHTWVFHGQLTGNSAETSSPRSRSPQTARSCAQVYTSSCWDISFTMTFGGPNPWVWIWSRGSF